MTDELEQALNRMLEQDDFSGIDIDPPPPPPEPEPERDLDELSPQEVYYKWEELRNKLSPRLYRDERTSLEELIKAITADNRMTLGAFVEGSPEVQGLMLDYIENSLDDEWVENLITHIEDMESALADREQDEA